MKYGIVALLLSCFTCLVGLPTQAAFYSDSSQAMELLSLAEKEKDPQQALTYTLQALAIGTRLENHVIIARSYQQLGYFYRRERRPQLYKLDSLYLYHAGLSGNKAWQFDALQISIKDYLNNNQVANAEKYLPPLDSLAEQADTTIRKCIRAKLKAFYYFKKFRPVESLAQAKNALYYAQLLQDKLLTGSALGQVADGFLYQFKHDSAIIYLVKAVEVLKETKEEQELARVYSQLGLLFQTTGNLSRAITYYEMSRASFENAGFPIDAAYVPLKMTDIYFAQHKNDTALSSINKSLTEFRKYAYLQGIGLCYSFLGRYYTKMDKRDSADHYTALSKETLKQYDNRLLSFYAEGYETVNALESGNFGKGDTLLRKFIRQAGTIAPPEFYDKAVDMVSFQGYGDAEKKALKQILRTGDTSWIVSDTTMINPFTGAVPDLDSLFAQRLHASIAAVETRYKVKETEQQLIQRTTILIFSILLLALSGILLYTQVKSRKRALAEKQRALTEKQRAIEDKATIKHLRDELGHRVGNILTNISFIINLVRDHSTDKASFDLLRQKVSPIMILYSILNEKKTETVHLQDYFEKICMGLKASYDHEDKIAIHIDAPVTMNGSKADRLGRILTELVTNSFKYAFQDQAPGRIEVTCFLHDDQQYYFSVTDSGPGIESVAGNGTQKGLQLVKVLAYELKATILDKQGAGACFAFLIPVNRHHHEP